MRGLLGGTKPILGWSALALAAGLGVAFVVARMAFEDSAQVRLGSALYAQHCGSCHGDHLQGQPDWQSPKADGRLPAPPHDASGHTWHHSNAELFRITKHGMAAIVPGHVSDMPAFATILTDDEILAVLAFIKSTWPRRERDYQDMRNRTGD